MKLEMIGEVGAPCGRAPSKQQIWARRVAAGSPHSNGHDMNSPRTLPKLIEGKKSARSTRRTHSRPRCARALVTALRLGTNPCTLCGAI